MSGDEFDLDRLVTSMFRRASWRVQRPPTAGGAHQPGFIVEGGGSSYAVQVRRSSEGRRDRVIPLLSQAILEAQAFAASSAGTIIPVAIVAAAHLPASVVAAAQDFAQRVAPQVAVGLLDAQGLRAFRGHGLEILNASPASSKAGSRTPRAITGPRRSPQLFTDLNQWMLKLLLASRIPAELLQAPRARYRNPTELARAAGVSVMSAFRLVRQLAGYGFVDPGAEFLDLVRIPELLSRWAALREPVQEFPVRWLVKRDQAALSGLLATAKNGRGPQLCLGLFAAADALGFGFVHGVPPCIYMERFDAAILQRLGLSAEGAGHNPDAFMRIPANPESVFRAAVITATGVPCSDILQVWLDVADHPARGREQAGEIARRALGALLNVSSSSLYWGKFTRAGSA